MKQPVQRESVIQRGILELLAYHQIPAWRLNQSGVPLHDGSGRYRPGPTRGMSDIVAILPGVGRWLAIECKRPGGKVTEAQAEFIARIINAGGLAMVADSIEAVEEVLRQNNYIPKSSLV